MSVPGNYNSTVIVVRSRDMKTAYDALDAACLNINDYLGDITRSLSTLQLDWTGSKSAAEMQQWVDRWMDAMTRLFGTQADPSLGILNVLASGVAGAAQNYAQAESNIMFMFKHFEQGLQTTPGAGQWSPGSNAKDVETGSGKPETRMSPQGGVTVSESPHGVYHTTSVNESGF